MMLNKYLAVRSQTEKLCTPLHKEDFIPQAVSYASPPKWHLAHTSWFFEDMILKKHLANYVVFDDQFTHLFNSYYQTVGVPSSRAERGVITRPTVDEIFAYRKYIDEHMQVLLSSDLADDVQNLVVVGLNHEQQHQELLITDLKYVFGLNPTFPVYDESCDYLKSPSSEVDWAQLSEGIYEIGYSGNGFCFDNELGRHKVYLPSFEISKKLVTNGEYIEFIENDAYQTFSHWLDEGWSWVQTNNIQHPLYWHLIDGVWHHYTLAGLTPVDLNVAVAHISYYEADAFARWKELRLPTEFEWEAAAELFPWGSRWEWTSSAYAPYPNFETGDGAIGEYNGKFMVNQIVLRGASNATANEHSRVSYRNFFHPHFQWQFSGIRLARYI